MHDSKIATAGVSSTGYVACPQTWIKPVLRYGLETRSGDVRFGHELMVFEGRISARVRGSDGHKTVIEAD